MLKKKHVAACLLAVSVIVAILFINKIKINDRDGFEGLFILKGEAGYWLTITDDLYPFESPLLLWSITSPSFKKAQTSGACNPVDDPCLEYEWNESTGRGFIKTKYPNGKILITAFGRFISTNGNAVSGLFVGGGLPVTNPDYQKDNNNEAGMTYFDGNRWFHIWCNVNEGIQDENGKTHVPSTWTFISSKVLENSPEGLTIVSKHQALINNLPIYIERYMFYETGNTYITINTTLKNIGTAPSHFMYVYGDEPWLGNYYTFSKGNIGWHKDGLVLTESLVDTRKYNYIGMFDYGNKLAGESNSFTGKANFLEWSKEERPDIAYFSNDFGVVATPERNVPLSSYKNRVVSLQWGPRALDPGQTMHFALNVGMAFNDPKTGYPVKPVTTDLHRFIK